MIPKSLFYSDQSNIRLLQSREVTNHCSILHSFAPSLDARKNEQPSEDYLCFEYSDTHLVFVVCDGVGQTVGSDYAARYLARYLINYLHSVDVQESKDAMAVKTVKFLDSITREAQRYVEQTKNPFEPGTVKHSFFESELREGSEVKFIAGTINFQLQKTVVFSVGDLLFAAMNENDQPLPTSNFWLGAWLRKVLHGEHVEKWEDDNSWSTRSGLANPDSLTVWSHDTQRLRSLTIASDGALPPFVSALRENRIDVDAEIDATFRVGKDDLSFLYINFDRKEKKRLPPVSGLLQKGGIIEWNPVEDAEHYRIYFAKSNSAFSFRQFDAASTSVPVNSRVIAAHVQAISSRAIASPWVEITINLSDVEEPKAVAPVSIATETASSPSKPYLLPEAENLASHVEESIENEAEQDELSTAPANDRRKQTIRYVPIIGVVLSAFFLFVLFAVIAPRDTGEPSIATNLDITPTEQTSIDTPTSSLDSSTMTETQLPSETSALAGVDANEITETVTPSLVLSNTATNTEESETIYTATASPSSTTAISITETPAITSSATPSNTPSSTPTPSDQPTLADTATPIETDVSSISTPTDTTTATPTSTDMPLATLTPTASLSETGRCPTRQAPADWVTYVIDPGDTLLRIAREQVNASNSVEIATEIMTNNCLGNVLATAGRDLRPGETILIPPPADFTLPFNGEQR